MIKNIFEETDNFKQLVKQFNLISFNEFKLYGCATGNDVILPIENKLQKYGDIHNLSFAVTDLKNLLEELKWNSNLNKIIKKSKFHISNVSIKEGYLDIKKQYENYILAVYKNFINEQQGVKFFSFKDFYNSFSSYILKNKKLLTFCSFIDSSYMSIFSSGLAFKLFDEQDLSIKIAEKYIADESFSIYHDICLRNNFLIDKYMPWVIVRRVNESFLGNHIDLYYSAYDKELNLTFDILKFAYIDYIDNFLTQQEKNASNVENFVINFDQFLNFYIQAKLNEKKVTFLDEDIENLKHFFKLNSKHNSQKESVKKFNKISNKRVDSVDENWGNFNL